YFLKLFQPRGNTCDIDHLPPTIGHIERCVAYPVRPSLRLPEQRRKRVAIVSICVMLPLIQPFSAPLVTLWAHPFRYSPQLVSDRLCRCAVMCCHPNLVPSITRCCFVKSGQQRVKRIQH